MSNVLKNIWGNIKIFCLNHETPIEMKIINNEEKIKTAFFNCPEYETKGCPNRLNLDDYQGLILKFLEMIEKEPLTDFNNLSFNYRGTRQSIFVKCIKYSSDEIKLGIINKTILPGLKG